MISTIMTIKSDDDKKDGKWQPINLSPQVYKALSDRAIETHSSMRKLGNEILLMALRKYKYLPKYIPEISLDAIGETSVYLKNIGDGSISRVTWKDNRVWCETHDSDSCLHVLYCLILPEAALLLQNLEREGTRE